MGSEDVVGEIELLEVGEEVLTSARSTLAESLTLLNRDIFFLHLLKELTHVLLKPRLELGGRQFSLAVLELLDHVVNHLHTWIHRGVV